MSAVSRKSFMGVLRMLVAAAIPVPAASSAAPRHRGTIFFWSSQWYADPAVEASGTRDSDR
jgi:hypothetical protein